MTKEELKNKSTERAKVFQQAMDDCKSSNPMDCIEWFADRIADLEKVNAELRTKYLQATDEGTSYAHLKNLESENRKLSDKLTKAKDHIKKLLDCLKQDTNDPETNYYVCQYMDKAEQFLNSDVEK